MSERQVTRRVCDTSGCDIEESLSICTICQGDMCSEHRWEIISTWDRQHCFSVCQHCLLERIPDGTYYGVTNKVARESMNGMERK